MNELSSTHRQQKKEERKKKKRATEPLCCCAPSAYRIIRKRIHPCEISGKKHQGKRGPIKPCKRDGHTKTAARRPPQNQTNAVSCVSRCRAGGDSTSVRSFAHQKRLQTRTQTTVVSILDSTRAYCCSPANNHIKNAKKSGNTGTPEGAAREYRSPPPPFTPHAKRHQKPPARIRHSLQHFRNQPKKRWEMDAHTNR